MSRRLGSRKSKIRQAQHDAESAAARSAAAAADDPRLVAAVEEYLSRLETGENIDIEAFVAEYSEIGATLRQCLVGLQFVQAAVPDLEESAAAISQLSTADTDIGGQLGDYRLIRELGRGGMGVVYEAEQLSLKRHVALKVLPFASVLDATRLRRFQNEALAAAGLEHPHIVPVYAVGCERGIHYYVMRLIQGTTLAEWVDSLRPLAEPSASSTSQSAVQVSPAEETKPIAALTTQPPTDTAAHFRRIAQWGRQAAEALQHAHDAGLVHRDIKPSNLLVDQDGRLWITDFGLAQLPGDTQVTLTGDILGTLRYTSPEQALGQRGVVDQRADVYSLGATLYELVTLRPALPAANRQELLRQIADHEPTAPHKLNPKCPRDLETIILAALAKEPSDRYATAQQMADDLNRFLVDRPVTASRPGAVKQILKWTRRHRSVVTAVAATLLVALLVGVVLIGRAYRSERVQRQVAEEERTRAQLNLRPARSAVDEMYTKVATVWLAEQATPTAIQLEFLSTALSLYQQLADDARRDPTQRREMAMAYERIAEVQTHLHDEPSALAAWQRAVETREQLIQESPRDEDCRLSAVIGHLRLAELHESLGALDEAESAYGQGLAHLDVLKSNDAPSDLVKRMPAIYALGRAGLSVRRGDWDDAEPLARQALQNLNNAFKDKRDHEAVILLGKANYRLTQILRCRGQYSEATELCRQALRQISLLRRTFWSDSRKVPQIEAGLNDELGELLFESGDLVEAERYFRQSLELQRRTFKAGKDPVKFYVGFLFKQENSLDPNNELPLFCGYVETQLRLARTLARQGRPYAAELVLGECTAIADVLCGTEPESLRYRVARANSWAQVALLLRQDRPEESLVAQQWAAATWQDTLAQYPHAVNYWTGLHGAQNDSAWFEDQFAGEQAAPLPYQEREHQAVKETSFAKHALAMSFLNSELWQPAVLHFEQAAQLRKSGQAFDWLRLAQATWHMQDAAAAQRWYDMARPLVTATGASAELVELQREVDELLRSQRKPEDDE
jgi:serine/threonine protein kinase